MKTPAPSTHDPARQDDADVREFEHYARTQDAAEVQAALWATRRHEGLDAVAEAEFQTWLAADPAHRTAHEDLQRSFAHVRALPPEQIQALKAGLQARVSATPDTSPTVPRPRPSSPARRAWLPNLGAWFPPVATALVLILLLGGWMGWDHWRNQPTFAQDYATQRGQRLDIDLPDGSTLQLDAATRAEVRLYPHRREVRLVDGQAMFQVHSDAAHPFDVLAGAMRVTVVGTRFSVRHTLTGLDANKTVVAVESGRVRVARAGGDGELRDAAPRVELTAGQGVSASDAGRLEPVVSLPPQSVAAWRQGRVSFNDTPLAQALLELERYGPTGLVLRDPAVGALRLGGSFDVRQVNAFAQALPHLLPVKLERRGTLTEVIGKP